MIPAIDLPIRANEVVQFHGRVLPEHWRITIGHPRHITWQHDDSAAAADFEVFIVESRVSVTCVADGPFLLGDLHRRALDISQAITDLIAFARGTVLNVIFDTVSRDGVTSPVAIYSPGVQAFCTAYQLESGFDEVLKLVLEDGTLFIALNDLNAGLAHHHLSPVNFGRVIESIRVMIAGPDAEISQAWTKMRDVLRVDKAYLKLVTDTSIPKRHGDHKRVDGELVATISERAWRVMDRFLIYRLRGSAPLPESEFPILSG